MTRECNPLCVAVTQRVRTILRGKIPKDSIQEIVGYYEANGPLASSGETQLKGVFRSLWELTEVIELLRIFVFSCIISDSKAIVGLERALEEIRVLLDKDLTPVPQPVQDRSRLLSV